MGGMTSARFTVLSPVCIRLEFSELGRFVDAPSLFAAGGEGAGRASGPMHVVGEGEGLCEIDTGRMVLRYQPDGRGFSAENLSITIGPDGEGTVWRPGMRNERNLGGTLETLDRVRGQTALPDGLLSRDGWYLLDDSQTHLLVDGWVESRPAAVAGNVDWYFFGYGTDYRAALRALGVVSGPVPMPRRYALGSWYSRYWPYTSKEYREIIGEYDRRGYPLDVIVMDMDWHKPGWTGWSWNRDLLPDAEELLGWFHENGLAVTLNLHPADGVSAHEDEYGAFMRAIGRDPATRETVPFDAGDRRYMEALFGCVHGALEGGKGQSDRGTEGQRGDGDHGVDFWWLDWQQEKFTRSIPDLSNLRWLNYLYFNHTAREGRRGCSFSRWAGWGDHRHPVQFSGDAHTGWDSLAFQVPFTAVAGNVGCFFWSHDIGGHFGPRLEEATTRWVQFGALSPVLRLHSARSGALDRKPWSYKPVYERSMHAAFQLRAELFPYLYTMARKCHTEMLPLCRPMYIDWPEAEEAYENPQQYMLGDSLLVAPITSPGVGPRKVATQGVWFPGEGVAGGSNDATSREKIAAWYHWETGERYEAGTEQLVAAAIDQIPLFVRGGAPVVTRGGSPTVRMATEPVRELLIVCYPGEPGTYSEVELYEDDGISDAHERGEFAVTRVRAWWFEEEVKLDVRAREGSFAGMAAEQRVVLELRGVDQIYFSRANNCPATAQLDALTRRVRITAPASDSGGNVRYEVGFASASHQATANPGEVLPRGFRVRDGRVRLYNVPSSNWENAELPESCEVSVIDTIGASATVRSRALVSVEEGHAIAIPMPETRIELPGLGLKASRSVVLDNLEGVSAVVETRVRPLLTFRVLGPFSYDPTKAMGEQRHGPELIPAADRLDCEYVDLHGNLITWREAPPADYWPQSIRKICGGHNGEALAYALTHVWSPEDQEVTLLLESGDRLELWLGDERVFSSEDEDEVEAAVEEVRVTLRRGWNQVMGKTNEGGGGWGFRVAIDGRVELREGFFGEGEGGKVQSSK